MAGARMWKPSLSEKNSLIYLNRLHQSAVLFKVILGSGGGVFFPLQEFNWCFKLITALRC